MTEKGIKSGEKAETERVSWRAEEGTGYVETNDTVRRKFSSEVETRLLK